MPLPLPKTHHTKLSLDCKLSLDRCYIFIYSGLIYQVEHSVNPEVFTTFLDAVYFSVVTMTTVGFGDVIPISDGGDSLPY